MKVKLSRSIVAAGKPRVAGDIVELSNHEAKFLISRDLAKEYKGNKQPTNNESTDETGKEDKDQE